jgi:hypothetical protein
MRLAGVDHGHLPGRHRAFRLAIVEGGDPFDHDQQLDVGMAVKARTLTWTRIDEDHARTDSAVLLADEVPRDDIARQLVRTEEPDCHERRCQALAG